MNQLNPNGAIRPEQLVAYGAAYQNSALQKAMSHVLAHCSIADAAIDDTAMKQMLHRFSNELPTMTVTAQKQTGRCWLFAALNLIRENIARENNLEFFECSQSYAAFWDKFERVNYFYESILATADREVGDRTVQYLLQTGVQDGGQWDMFVNLVKKYGIVPKDAMPETKQSSASGDMNRLLNEKIRGDAARLRRMVAEHATDAEIASVKDTLLRQAYGFLCSCYGEPPKTFDFEYVDRDNVYHVERDHTPQTFAEKYVGDMLSNYVSIINAPTQDKPFHHVYTVELLGNVVEGDPVRHLNLPMDEFKALVLQQLGDGEPVWFGSDISYFGSRPHGVWDDGSFDYPSVTGFTMETTKAERLDHCISAMNHAMVLTGVNLCDGAPNRWKIENSWGDETGNKGYYVCSDTWFDQYVFQAVIHKKYLSQYEAVLAEPLVQLKPWDPMGSLAD